jgi:DNA-binding transcriptional ArsR family regulator
MTASSKTSPHGIINDQLLELIAGRFKALSEPVRLKLILALEEGERNVTDLVLGTGVSQANVSRHLQQLARAGILGRRKAGAAVFYRISDPAIFELCNHVCGSLKQQIKREADAARLMTGTD